MILKIQNQAIESGHGRYEVRATTVRKEVCNILKFKLQGLDKGLLISDNLIAEAEKFMLRNEIQEAGFQCCPRCLKAHIIRTANETGATKAEIEFLNKVLTGEMGHHGFYMDEGKLSKVIHLE